MADFKVQNSQPAKHDVIYLNLTFVPKTPINTKWWSIDKKWVPFEFLYKLTDWSRCAVIFQILSAILFFLLQFWIWIRGRGGEVPFGGFMGPLELQWSLMSSFPPNKFSLSHFYTNKFWAPVSPDDFQWVLLSLSYSFWALHPNAPLLWCSLRWVSL